MVDDCEVVSRELSDILDEKDFIDEAYILEVSSPGTWQTAEERKRLCKKPGRRSRGSYLPGNRQTERVYWNLKRL